MSATFTPPAPSTHVDPDPAWQRFKAQVAQTQAVMRRRFGVREEDRMDPALLAWLSEATRRCTDLKSAFRHTARQMMDAISTRSGIPVDAPCPVDLRMLDLLNRR